MFLTVLPTRAIISLSGEDTISFLQGLISNDALKISENNAIYAALLSPQGKFLHDFFLIKWRGKVFIDVQADRAQDLLSRLKIYRLRSKVEIMLEESLEVAVIWGKKMEVLPSESYTIYPDPRLSELGFRAVSEKNALHGFEPASAEKYNELRLSLTVPDTCDMIVDKSLLLECGFEELHGVDFGKGCYVGQEVTARSKFRGQVRKQFYKVSAQGDLPQTGTEIMVGEKSIGQLRSSAQGVGIALINNDGYQSAKESNAEILCNGVKITVLKAQWASHLEN